MGRLKQPGKPGLFEDQNDRKESPWMIDSDLEEKIREKAAENGRSPGEEFRQTIRQGL